MWLNRLWVRITLAFVVMILLSAAAIGIAARNINNDSVRDRLVYQQLDRPGGLLDRLARYNQRNPDWEGIDTFMSGAQSAGGASRSGLYFVLTDADNQTLHDSRPDDLENETWRTESQNIPINNLDTDEVVGYLSIYPRNRSQDSNAPPPRRSNIDDPLSALSSALWIALLVLVPLGILASILISRTLTSPLNQLVDAARDVGSGNLNRRVELSGTVEIREVANAFNEMTTGLEESEQLRRNLVADIADELRTPLTVVQGNLRAILDDVYPLNKEEIARLYDQTRILAQLVQDLRDVAQAEAGQLELNLVATNVGQLVETTVATFGSIAEEESVALHIDTQKDLPAVQLDSTRIAQVLHNLLSNAMRYTPSGGSVSVSVSPVGVTSASGSSVGGTSIVEFVEISVSDSGTGIAPEHLPRIFDRFYRTERARDRDSGGTGLGLAIAQALVTAHGGSIRAESDGIGKGSTFTISLPVAR